MSPALAGVVIAVVLGGVIAVSAATPRTAVLGLLIVLVSSAFLADPLPDTVGLAARIVAAALAGELLWIAVRGRDRRTEGSRLGWPAELLVAGAGLAVGYGSSGLGAPPGGPGLAQAAGFALGALAVAPILNGHDLLRTGLGLNLLAAGSLLVVTSLAGTPAPDSQLLMAGFTVVLGGSVAAFLAAAHSDGTSFEPWSGARMPARRAPDARPPEPH